MKIVIVGTGKFGTALGNALAYNKQLDVILLGNENEVVFSINKKQENSCYFPNKILHSRLKATENIACLKKANIIFLAIPSTAIPNYIIEIKEVINKNAIVVNLAKGFGIEKTLLYDDLKNHLSKNSICSLKGPTFALELINNVPTGFTVGVEDESLFQIFKEVFENTQVYLDYTNDIIGIEILSILKNIYAIVLGIIDAHFNSANGRFLILTKSFEEMKNVLIEFGGKEETLFKLCGFGDFGLTALNDLSRNRTLGLLIGKGFFNDNISSGVVLEGKRALNIVYEKISQNPKKYPFIYYLHKLFSKKINVTTFIQKIFTKYF